jgi:hypothetical protein
MAGMQQAYFGVQAETTDEAKIEGLSIDLEVMKDPDDIDQKRELIRWIVKLDISTLLNNLQILTIATPMTTAPRLEGRMRGGAVVNLQLDSAYFAYASWKLTHEEVRGINEEGSLQCGWMQSWVGTTEWAAAPWNK